MATITRRKGKGGTVSYTAQIRLTIDGQKYTESKTSGDRRFLVAWAATREEVLCAPGAIERSSHSNTTIGDVFKWYCADFQGVTKFGRSKMSHIEFLMRLPEFAGLNAVSLSASELIAHARERVKTVAPSTALNDFIWLTSAMRAVRLSREIPLNIQAVEDALYLLRKERVVATGKTRSRRPSLDELGALLSWFESRDARKGAVLPMTDIVLFALFSSRRQDEICSICWEDLDERRKGVVVREMKHPRNKTDTFVFLPEPAWAIVNRQPKTEERIFPYVSKSVSSAFTRSCSSLGIEDLRFHDLRHEAVSWLFELGWDIPRVSGVSGHKSWASLQRYTHINEREAFDKYAGWEWLPAIASL